MKLAGHNRDNRKLSATNYAKMCETPVETQSYNRQALAVVEQPEFDESNAEFFVKENGSTNNLDDCEMATLDALIEKRGLADVLKAAQSLLESRIEHGLMMGGVVMLHLSRHDKWARAAERLSTLAYHPDIAQL